MLYRFIILLATVLGAMLLLSPWPPLGVTGEWVWPRHALPADLLEALDRLLWPVICGVVVATFCATGWRRIKHAGQLQQSLLVLVLTGLSFFWLNAVRQAAPSPHRELRPLWILFDRFASGYFFEATFNVTSTKEMLADYEARIAKGDVLHEGTHPPGLLLFNRGLLRLTETSPAIVRFSEILQNQESVRMFRQVEAEARISRPLSKPELAALHLSALLSTLLAAMTVIPVFGVTRRLADATTAWQAAALMITVPTIGVFVPRSDVVYACSGMFLTWFTVAGLLTENRLHRWLCSVLAGLSLFGCLLLSLAHVPIIVMLAIFTFGFVLQNWKHRIRHACELTLVAAASFVLLCGIWQLWTHCNLFNVWQMNLSNHAGFYAQSVRTWSAWFLTNPLELAMSIGLPMASMALMLLGRIIQIAFAEGLRGLTISRLFAVACAFTWILLWLSGKNMGEAARLWCFVTPWMSIIAAQAIEPDTKNARRTWLMLLVMQLLTATITVGRVSGFLEFAASQ
jgi:hypothetical protein